jgi:hypothetical protein
VAFALALNAELSALGLTLWCGTSQALHQWRSASVKQGHGSKDYNIQVAGSGWIEDVLVRMSASIANG